MTASDSVTDTEVGTDAGSGASADATVVYESEVTQVGGQVEAFLGHGLLIFFGDTSPVELHDISVLHRASVADDGPRPGDLVQVGEVEMEVLAVGPVVRDNLLNLGHLDLKADGRTEVKLPGDVCVRTGDLPLLAPGDTFRITRPGGAATGPSSASSSEHSHPSTDESPHPGSPQSEDTTT